MSEMKNKKDQSKTYLGKLKFKKEFLNSLPGRYLRNIRLMIILILAVVSFGIYSFITTPKTLNPQVEIPFVIVSTTLPGAGPNEVESLVTIPLEKEIKNANGLTTYSSASRENVSIITAEFTSETQIQDARDRIQAAVDKVNNLPEDASSPQVSELDFENFPVITFTLTKDKNPQNYASLMRLAQDLETKLENIQSVDRVEVTGLDQRDIHITIKPETIKEKNINPFTLSEKISNKLKSYPAGKVKTTESSFSLTIDQPFNSIEEIRNLDISFQGQNYKLFEIAVVAEKTSFNQAETFYIDPEIDLSRSIIFEVYKTTSAELDETGIRVRENINEFMTEYNETFQTNMIIDYSNEIDKQFNELWNNLGQTLFLVFLSMLLLYGIKQALIAAAIPIALLIVFSSMQFWGISINFVSIFSILIALGLFVDNAVVIIEAYTSYYRTSKFTPLQTAILVWKDFFIELFSINLLTVWAFLPLLISTGIIGEFIYPIPIIVSIAMLGSAGVAILFTLPSMMIVSDFKIPKRVQALLKVLGVVLLLPLAYFLIPKTFLFIPSFVLFIFLLALVYFNRRKITKEFKNKICKKYLYKNFALFMRRAFNKGFISLDFLTRRYNKIVTQLLESRSARIKTLIIIISFTLFSYFLLPLGLVKNEFFPKSDQNRVYIQLELPEGTNLDTTTQETKQIMQEIKDTQGMDFAGAELQKVADTGFAISSPGTNNAKITLALKPENKRQKSSMQIAQALRSQFSNYTKGKIQIVEESSGPPAGADLQINLTGEDLEQLQNHATQIEEFLRNTEGTANINRSIKKGTSKLAFVPNKEKLVKYGLDEAQIGFWLRTFTTGFNINELEIDNRDLDISLKMHQDLIGPEMINSLQIPTQTGYIPINELGKIVLKPSPSLITRENGERTLSVSASTLPGYNSPEINQQLEEFVRNKIQFDEGYAWNTGGVNEENQKSIQSILEAMIISLLLILATMVIQLESFRNALIVILVIPLAASGVFILFALTGTPLSFPALIGILSLFGIVIANSLMIVNRVQQNKKIGLSMKESIVDASTSRLEPILLTTASQIIGLIPITLSDPLWRGMGGAIIAGMSFSGIIMLFFIPIIYYYFFPEKRSVN